MICSAQVHRESFFEVYRPLIINIEAQKNEPNEYDILNRAIFYVSRMISSQKEKDFLRLFGRGVIWTTINDSMGRCNEICSYKFTSQTWLLQKRQRQ